MSIEALARAKVNLCLHVTGQRSDGLHMLDSLVVFPQIGDAVTVEEADSLSLEIEGPFAGSLEVEGNLVLQAARLVADKGATIRLEKNLPVASGIGGGSADAAATIRALSRLWGEAVPSTQKLVQLGADVPVCMEQKPVRMQGIGEVLTPLPALPDFWILLVNAGEAVNTGAVFNAIDARKNPPLGAIPDSFPDTQSLFAFLGRQRNDMEAAACRISTGISEVLDQLNDTEGCALSRMSGSGGTCFGLFPKQAQAQAAAEKIGKLRPNWWVRSARV